jgi:peptidoglycan/LPS O-acetylase OafA/YrhL
VNAQAPSVPPQRDARVLHIDVFRGVAIALVTGFHLWRYLGKPSLSGSFLGRRFDVFGPLEHGGLGVDLFFFISGFCLALGGFPKFRAQSYGAYARARFLRIAPPYYAAILVWNLLIRFGDVARKPVSLVHNLSHLLFVHNLHPRTFFSVSGVFWSIAVEMQFYLMLPLLLPYLHRSPLRAFGAVTAVSVLVQWFGADVVSEWSVLAFLPLFVAGSLCALHRERVSAMLGKAPLMVALPATFLLPAALYDVAPFRVAFGLLLGLTMMAWSNWIEQSRSFVFRALAWLGRISFSVYLYNYVFHALPSTPGIFGWLTGGSLVVGVGAAMHYLVEKPSLRLRGHWMKPARPAQTKVTSDPPALERTL